MRVPAVIRFTFLGLLLMAPAGSAWTAEIILYDHRNFEGRSLTLNQSVADLDDYDFDNKVSAVIVVSGTWELFRDDDYESRHGPSKVLGPGEFPNLSHVDFRRNRLSSVRLISDDNGTGNGQAQPDCPGPYHVLASNGRCVWSCSAGTQPAPSGECECQPGLVETGQDQFGRRTCTAPGPNCPGPYHVLTNDGRCVWSCSAGTQPGASGECECQPGYVETGQDNFGRRVCTSPEADCPGPYQGLTNDGRCVWSCSAGTQPGASGECECQPGLVETGEDNFGRRVCSAPPEPTLPTPRADCIPFDWRDVRVRNVSGSWKLVERGNGMLDFGNNSVGANTARSIIRRYRMTKQCFVGRPNASMQYWLRGNQAPVGPFQSEDCVRFNPARIEVRQVRGSWKIVEGSHWIMDFGANRAEAEEALAIVNQYGFRRMCFVGRPNPPMTYFRR